MRISDWSSDVCSSDLAYKQACLNAINYLTKFGYSPAQGYALLGSAPVQGHISGVVDIPNACATLWLPTEIFEFDINPNANGHIKHLDGSIRSEERRVGKECVSTCRSRW